MHSCIYIYTTYIYTSIRLSIVILVMTVPFEFLGVLDTFLAVVLSASAR